MIVWWLIRGSFGGVVMTVGELGEILVNYGVGCEVRVINDERMGLGIFVGGEQVGFIFISGPLRDRDRWDFVDKHIVNGME